jgi:hypothetical protein
VAQFFTQLVTPDEDHQLLFLSGFRQVINPPAPGNYDVVSGAQPESVVSVGGQPSSNVVVGTSQRSVVSTGRGNPVSVVTGRRTGVVVKTGCKDD